MLSRLDMDMEKMASMKSAICRYYQISPSRLFDNCRKRSLVTARHMFHYNCHKKLGIPSNIVGMFSKRDHATVLHSKRQIENWMDVDESIVEQSEAVMELYTRPSTFSLFMVLVRNFIKDVRKIIKYRMS